MLVTVGKIGRAHGLRGEVSIEVRTDQPEVRFAPGAQVLTVPDQTVLTVASSKSQNGRWLVHFDSVPDRTAAEALRSVELQVEADAPEVDDDAWYEHELIDLAVVLTTGERVGTVIGLENFPAQDLIVFKETNGTINRIPLVEELVPEVDTAAGRIIIDPPGGLLSTDADQAIVDYPEQEGTA